MNVMQYCRDPAACFAQAKQRVLSELLQHCITGTVTTVDPACLVNNSTQHWRLFFSSCVAVVLTQRVVCLTKLVEQLPSQEQGLCLLASLWEC